MQLSRAGAQWRTHAPKEDTERSKWDMETFQYWRGIVDYEKGRDVAAEMRAGLGVSLPIPL